MELEATAEYDDRSGTAATRVLDNGERLTVHAADAAFDSSRVDAGEATCARLADDLGAEFLLTDDLRALPELQKLTAARVAISPIALKALVERDALTEAVAEKRLQTIAETRSWLGRPIYRRARDLSA